MFKPTKDEFMKILENNPALCVHGLCDSLQKNYQANRKSLETSYDTFLICFEWLAEENVKEQGKISSLSSIELKHEIESQCGQFIPHGTVLAAAIFLGNKLNSKTFQPQRFQVSAP